jgi:phage anti-repressor protein
MDTNKADGIPVKKIYRNGKEWVDARSLHQELKIKWRYSGWIKRHLERNGFTCGVDYELFLLPPKHGGHKLYEYYISPDTVDKILTREQNVRASYTFNTFSFDERQLRVTIRDDKLWFMMRDIAHILNLSQLISSNVYDLDDKDRTVIFIPDDRLPTGVNRCLLISEFGLLSVAFRSNMQGAKEVCKWLINEALPQIRKAYTTPEPTPSIRERFFKFIKTFTGGVK